MLRAKELPDESTTPGSSTVRTPSAGNDICVTTEPLPTFEGPYALASAIIDVFSGVVVINVAVGFVPYISILNTHAAELSIVTPSRKTRLAAPTGLTIVDDNADPV